MKKILFTLALLLIFTNGATQTIVDSIYTFSPSMQKQIKSIVIHQPEKLSTPTIFILHGWSGNPKRTITKDIPTLHVLSNIYKVNFVIPDGNYDSWYIDSPIINSSYETFITKELYNDINQRFPMTINQIAIMGWSMGGHGALFLGARHPSKYAAIGAISAAIDFRSYGKRYGVETILGDMDEWYPYTAISQVNKLKNSKQFITISCGYQDEFIQQNRLFHQLLINLNINHLYTESNGNHTANYWSLAAHQQIIEIINYFKRTEK